ncbi:agmatinase [Methanohalobium evestigatum Z-7303]|uniref:Agmatinase n=1 Tax=Methanohalobium evestigatum (strain ATCC BAA-1072 / DSM 3721 / NBRC 107634 / OCM 161 / Z-7303) TaxID=644295 RepID=D7EBC4_METEZ|nr:agmatinase [Methanohalobium evestigatum]ADI74641.1 agmatinase [Methanohalobium evestigatum Z-7303]
MFYQPGIMDAMADYESARYVIFGVPFDGTSSYRVGSRWAPDSVRTASSNFESYNSYFDIDFVDLNIYDAGNLETFASVDDTLRELYNETDSLLRNNKVPLMVGGEHSLTYPCVKACKENVGDDFGVVVLDAHFDLRDEFDGVKHSHASVSRHITDDISSNYVLLGVRSGTREEWEFARDNNIKFYTPEDIRKQGINTVISEVVEYLNSDSIYLSLDMDAFDSTHAPATGTPEPFGLDPFDVRHIIHALAPISIGFDLMEIVPGYDTGQTAILGAKLMREFIASHASGKK